MIITQKLGQLRTIILTNWGMTDLLVIWHEETLKHMLHKITHHDTSIYIIQEKNCPCDS